MANEFAKNVELFRLKDDFIIFKERLELIFVVKEITAPEKKKVFLLTALSIEVYKILRNMCSPKTPNDKTYDELVKMLSDQFVGRTIIAKERRKFHEAKQESNETVLDYYNKLQALAVSCDFKGNLDFVLADKFVCGVRKGGIFERLCDEQSDQKIDKYLKSAMEKEAAMTMEIEHVHKIQGRPQVPKNNWKTFQSQNQVKCHTCGVEGHVTNGCKYKRYRCNKCGCVGHLARVCKNESRKQQIKRNHMITDVTDQSEINHVEDVNDYKYNASDESVSLFTVDVDESSSIRLIKTFEYHDYFQNIVYKNDSFLKFDMFSISSSNMFVASLRINDEAIPFEIDTGSAISAIPYTMYREKLSKNVLKPYKVMLRSYNGGEIETAGFIDQDVVYGGKKYRVPLVVIKNGCRPLIGRDVFKVFGFSIYVDVNSITNLSSMSVNEKVNSLINEFKSLFSDKLGTYNGEKIALKMKKDVQPKFVKPRAVPFAYREKLDDELDRLEKEGIISKVENSMWGTPLVTVMKKDGSLRVCADYSVTVNSHLEDVNYPLPRIDCLFNSLQGGQKFTKIDLSQAYLQLPLSKKSAEMLAWSTQKGIYVPNRLPFGCKPNTSIFQSVIEKTLLGCNGTVVFVDDIVVTGKDDECHLKNLRVVFEKLQAAGFTANKLKCSFFADSISYLGFVIDKQGLHKDESKVKAVSSMPQPKNVKEVKAFCGLVNYYGRFFPNLSSVLKPLYDLSAKGQNEFQWNDRCESAMSEVKRTIVSDIVLVHFDPKLPVVITSDASEYGIGACLSHITSNGEQPISFVSRTLSKCERNYSVIDREALALYFGVRKFEQYIMGRKFIIRMDHKPLESLFGKKKGIPSMAASRLQRWAVYLSNFDFEIKYLSGCENGCADALSRLPDSTEIIENNEREFSYLNFVTNEFQKPIKGADVAIQSNVDPILKIVIKYTKDGWPKNVQFKEELESFYSRRHQLTLEQDILMWGHRVVIPQKFRNVLMNELHSTHQGIVRIKSLARSFFWWPRIDKDLENLVKSCEICRRNQNDPPRIPYSNWPEAKVPFERIHLDFCGPIQNLCYLILIDAYSKWLEVIPMKETVTEKLIETLKNIFVRFGFPRVIVSDNGPQFVSGKFVTFCEANGIKHMTSPPYHPPSNGQAENSVRTFKMAFEKMLVDPQNSNDSINEIVNKLLYLNRNTPHTVTDKTPYQLMFNRKGWLRWELLAPKKQKMKSGNNVKNFAQNESVYAKDFRTNKWVKAKIKNFIGKYCYIVLTENNLTWKRHANHIIKASQSEHKTLINDNSSSAKESGNSFSNILEEKAKMIPTVSTSYCTSDMETSNTGKNPNNSNSTNTVNLGDVTSNVRPKRNIKCPDRLNL